MASPSTGGKQELLLSSCNVDFLPCLSPPRSLFVALTFSSPVLCPGLEENMLPQKEEIYHVKQEQGLSTRASFFALRTA